MKKMKIGIVIVIMIFFWFSFDYVWYRNFKHFYELSINDRILDIKQGKGGIKIVIKRIKDDNFYIYCDNEEYLKIGDSISKKSKSDEIKIYRKSVDTLKWSYYRRIYISKNLDFYSLIIKI
ncbi:hypothetical protein D0817_05425 [Flavobacterium cupreum]|uniref:Uncharacterized protein n=1 Tax=Flavobacterium cupreum TaxID=2133766 RepID=A0A434AAD9_9FLAO|nr:hypothetical protein [Flavobacterium cupreum]RUT71317.1 hypothetical protein D0817_05425 [Flavobacterium cupreum]